jgi:7-cyano-7-deazaguanine reductase
MTARPTIETFPAPAGCSRVRFVTDEVTSVCPITGGPDVSTVLIDYVPSDRCVESRSLKHYLWSFRDEHVFAEALAADIARDVQGATGAPGVRVVVTQHIRGGIVTECTSELGDPPPITTLRPRQS